MNNTGLKRETYLEIEDIISNSLSDENISEDKEDLLLEYLCQTITKTENVDSMKKRAAQGDQYAFIQLASWHIAHADNIKDYCAAFSYAQKALKYGYSEAYYILGQLYFYGTGCERNIYRASKCFKHFVEEMNPKYLINESVLADSYIKLATIERMRGRFDKVNYYYERLVKLYPEYQNYYDDYKKEVKQKQSESTNSIIYFIVSFLFLICGGMALFQYIRMEQHTEEIVLDPKVKYIEAAEKIDDSKVPTDIHMTERTLYRLVSKDEFDSLQFSEVSVASVDATSTFISKTGNNFSPYNLIDHRKDTYWQEGVEGAGVGQRLTFLFPNTVILNGIMLENGKQNVNSNDDFYVENNRVKKLELVEDDRLTLTFPDEENDIYVVFEEPVIKEKISFILREVYEGTKYDDTCITEIHFFE